MELKTYRAATMREALAMVKSELGPDAAVLHTREVSSRRLFGWIKGPPQIEVTASCEVNVPSRLEPSHRFEGTLTIPPDSPLYDDRPTTTRLTSRPGVSAGLSGQVQSQLVELQDMVKELCRRSHTAGRAEVPEGLYHLFTELLEVDLSESLAREFVGRVQKDLHGSRMADVATAKSHIAQLIASDLRVTGPIQIPGGRRRLVALVGPTGVGKTTTIAKLAAQYRLKEKRRVGFITVDTYRIAAVEQLRTYADIIDLPMQVVSTPREMREAVRRMDDLELILMDTAGRSPKDEVRIQELRAFLGEAEADEVHLVLSSTAGNRALEQTAERFAAVGTTAVIFTKLDEAPSLGNLLSLARASGLPLSYLTNGQNVPDDIEVADSRRLARLILKMDDHE